MKGRFINQRYAKIRMNPWAQSKNQFISLYINLLCFQHLLILLTAGLLLLNKS